MGLFCTLEIVFCLYFRSFPGFPATLAFTEQPEETKTIENGKT